VALLSARRSREWTTSSLNTASTRRQSLRFCPGKGALSGTTGTRERTAMPNISFKADGFAAA
jgi:hypothetical protein